MGEEKVTNEIIKQTVKLQFETNHLFHKNFAKTASDPKQSI